MTERNQHGYKSPTESEAIREILRDEAWTAYKAEHPLPRSPKKMNEDDLYEADRNRPVNKWVDYNEAQEQTALIDWAKLKENAVPELKLLFHIPNGGSRHAAEAANLKRQGVKSGVPDLMLPVPRGIYHGLFIEMKTETGRVSEAQKTWLRKLNAQGYLATVCRGFDAARKVIEEYLNE